MGAGEATVQQVRDRVIGAFAGVHDDPVRDAKAGKGGLAYTSPRGSKLHLPADSIA